MTPSHLSEVLERGHQKETFQTQQKSKIGAKSRGSLGELAPPKRNERNQMPPEAAAINSVAVTAFLCFGLSLLCLTVPVVRTVLVVSDCAHGASLSGVLLEWQIPHYAGLETASRFLMWLPFCNVCRCFWVPISVVSSGDIALFLCSATPETNCSQPLHIPEQDEAIFI